MKSKGASRKNAACLGEQRYSTDLLIVLRGLLRFHSRKRDVPRMSPYGSSNVVHLDVRLALQRHVAFPTSTESAKAAASQEEHEATAERKRLDPLPVLSGVVVDLGETRPISLQTVSNGRGIVETHRTHGKIRTDFTIGIAEGTPRYMGVLVEANWTIVSTPVLCLIEEVLLHRTSLARDGDHIVLGGVQSRVRRSDRKSYLTRETDVQQEIDEVLHILSLANTRLHAELKTSRRRQAPGSALRT